MLSPPSPPNPKIVPLYSQDEIEDPDDYTQIYILFSGALQYPVGGWKDFKGHFSTVELAVKFLNSSVDIYDREWFQIVNIDTREVVMQNDVRRMP